MRRLLPSAKAPLGLAGFLAIPLFFASLMAVSLAIEKPKAYEWMRHGKLFRIYHDPIASTEAKIWLLAFVPALLLVAIGFAASHLRRVGLYAVSLAAIGEGLLLLVRLGHWERNHTSRYPFGEDLYPDSSTSSLTNRGQWEHNAAHTVKSLVGYTVGLALAAIALTLFFTWRGRGRAQTTHSELQQTGGAPTVSSGV